MALELHGVRVKLARARDHLDTLEEVLDDWRLLKPYSVEPETELRSGDQLWKITSDPVHPGDLPVIGDLLYNLRSGLDHLAWQMVIKAGSKPTSRTEFPIFNDPKKWEKDSPRKMAGMNDAMQLAIQNWQPCFGWNRYFNESLWGLHEYGNTDKHRTLLVTPVSTEDMLWQPGGSPIHLHKGQVKKNTILARFPAGQHQSSLMPMPSVALREAPSADSELHRTLYFTTHVLELITNEFEEAFF